MSCRCAYLAAAKSFRQMRRRLKKASSPARVRRECIPSTEVEVAEDKDSPLCLSVTNDVVTTSLWRYIYRRLGPGLSSPSFPPFQHENAAIAHRYGGITGLRLHKSTPCISSPLYLFSFVRTHPALVGAVV